MEGWRDGTYEKGMRERRVAGRAVWVDWFPAYLLGCRLAAFRNICERLLVLSPLSASHLFHLFSFTTSSLWAFGPVLSLRPVFLVVVCSSHFFCPSLTLFEKTCFLSSSCLCLSVCQSELPFLPFFPPCSLSEWLCSPEVDLTGGCMFSLVWTRFLLMLQHIKTAEWELQHQPADAGVVMLLSTKVATRIYYPIYSAHFSVLAAFFFFQWV